MSERVIRVESWGVAGSIRDAGRPGLARFGAARGGAVDLGSLHLANRLVGNPAGAAGFESSGGLQLSVVSGAVMVAVGGGVAAIDVAGGPPLGWGAPVVLPAGSRLRVGRLVQGTRVYLAVRGGVAAIDGYVLSVGPDPNTPAATEPAPRPGDPERFRVWPGPRLDWFAPDTWRVLTTSAFTVGSASDRVGMRLSGAGLARVVTSELPPEGIVEGAVQVPPDGAPIVMLADHPVTGGYPVAAVVDPRDLGPLSQMPPGSAVRFSAGH